MKCNKCGHDDRNLVGKCLAQVEENDVEITGQDGKKYIMPVMYDICACKEQVHVAE